MSLSSLFSEKSFGALPGWGEDDHRAAFAAFRRSAFHVLTKPYRSGSLGVGFEAFAGAYQEARAVSLPNRAEARTFFERHFVPAHVAAEHGGAGLVTGFYEPEVEASPVRTDRFTVPLLSRPADLIDVQDANRPDGMDPYLAFARETGDGLAEYFDRCAIERGALAGNGLEIAWLADKVDAFFIHVQGAARLKMTDGRLCRVTYAAKSGQRFTGPGKILSELGEIPLAKVTMQSIRAWFRAHPDRVDEILWQNRSYIFFREAAVDDAALGPIAAAKVPLTPGRSVAVDRLLHTFGTPFYIDAPTLAAFGDGPFRRLMIAQDTGSAITGPARGDLFAGSGDAAGEIAGVVRNAADFYALIPRQLVSGVVL
ncbi:transglycosylase [Mesorhizobium sp. M4B.F.Ca.ET.215.01.1.1]|uniref:murein transglycosylase A n=2 Tax=Mesorhizobium TaxID=68287 RepID=UPI000FCC3568|nr:MULTISPECIES: murein transglycosylase A [unclassified Mesorhizobium]RUW22813.1 transglycosylase [Mesorhizobium sp. M4B.F.Ca.ET.013.02.1.1]RVD46172.1 transglycosylase [Mesorhizobium sp. M4B.F.Ca.ET.019.03.1.1]RWX69575.1 transglycosylase [Mesorhizobium sp. M4B.F.Ca.ET.089.01.1.1]TGQ04722.1 transglycosylase [Mesorhizobium sp. M4B.F.Ca.ET.215.01.1.1]TGQ27772.1 transglycosylase [Mesorhizobium sp. M00.F.Ca.ET.220.01.1.1]